MDRHLSLPSFPRALTRIGAAVLLAAGCAACGLVGPAADHGPERSATRPPGADRWAETRRHARDGEPTRDAERGLTYLVLRLGERRLYLMSGDTNKPESFPVAIGQEGWETPTGRFRVKEMLEHPDFVHFDWNDPGRVIKRIRPGPANPLGMRWIGFATAYGWAIGFHGTPQPELLGRAVSHGCVRMRNADVVRVYDRIQVGTTVIVEP